jgi:hypothetical protein
MISLTISNSLSLSLYLCVGVAGGGIYCDGGRSYWSHVVVKQCVSGAIGGGLVAHRAQLYVDTMELRENLARTHGGGLYLNLSHVYLQANTNRLSVTANLAHDRGGGAFMSQSTLRSIMLKQKTRAIEFPVHVSSNEAKGDGGGFAMAHQNNYLAGVVVEQNVAWDGAGVFLAPGATVVAFDMVVQTGQARKRGGGLFLSLDAQWLNTESQALPRYQAMDNDKHKNNVIVSGNLAQRTGGGVYLSSQSVLAHVEIYGNRAPQGGGAMVGPYATNVTLDSVNIHHNSAFTVGGGVAIVSSHVVVVASSVRLNRATSGGGVSLENTSVLEHDGG